MDSVTTLYKTSGYKNDPLKKVYKKYLGGTVYKRRLYNQCGIYKKDIGAFNAAVLETERLNGYKTYKIFGKEVYSRPQEFLVDFKKECIDSLDKKYDDVYVLLRHIGDAYGCLIFIHELIKKNNSKQPLIMVFSSQFNDLVKMTCPDIPCVFINSKKPFTKRLFTRFSKEFFEFCGIRFYPLTNSWILGTKLGRGFQKAIDESQHRLYAYSYFFDIKLENCSIERAKVLPDAESSMIYKCRQNSFNLEKFVFLAAETFSGGAVLLPLEFWRNLIKEFNKKGYDVYVNTVAKRQEGKQFYHYGIIPDYDIGEPSNYKSFYLTLAECFALASKAKKIVAIRSGLTELLSQCDSETYILYTGDIAKKAQAFNTLSKYPCTNKVKLHEFVMTEVSIYDCIKNIVEGVS